MAHEFPVRVYYEDTDMGGIVYYANYLRYIERARSDWVRVMGVDQNAMREEQGIVFVVKRVDAEYIAPAKFDDDLRVVTSLTRLTGARLEMTQQVVRGSTLLFKADVTATCVGPNGSPVRLPAELRRLKP